jgi:hypothetical protein
MFIFSKKYQMKNILSIALWLAVIAVEAQTLQSPSKEISVTFSLAEKGSPSYAVNYKGKPIILPSLMGVYLKGESDLASGFTVDGVQQTSVNESWKPVLGEQSTIRNQYNQMTIALVQAKTGRKMNIIFKAYDEGIAFRYDFPKQEKLNYFIISDERTEFQLTANHKVFWLPGDYDSQEYPYTETKFSDINTDRVDKNNGIALKSIGSKTRIQTPLMMKTFDKLYLNIFEAAVVNYPVMHLDAIPSENELISNLVPNAIGDKAYLQTPCVSPWRTIMVSDDARDIVGSKMILNLNEPSKIDDTSWIKPMKYVGIWWEMHVGKSTWDYAGSQNAQNAATKELIPSGKHGATTANTKRYIDFAAKNGFDGVLVEGWNVGWEDWFGNWKENVFDFTTPYPDFNLDEVNAYAKAKGVKMIMHHETSGSVGNYERHLDRAFDLMKKYDYPAVKSGYVGKIIPRGEFHDGQAMVNHYNFVASVPPIISLWSIRTKVRDPRGTAALTRITSPPKPRVVTNSMPGAPGIRPCTKPFCHLRAYSVADGLHARYFRDQDECLRQIQKSRYILLWPSNWRCMLRCIRRCRWPPIYPKIMRNIPMHSNSSRTSP